VVKEAAKEITGREAESALKERGKHHNLIRIGCDRKEVKWHKSGSQILGSRET
jgi:hypothetical protein